MFATMLIVSKEKKNIFLEDYEALYLWPKCDFCEEPDKAKTQIEEDFEIKINGNAFPFYVSKEYAENILAYAEQPDIKFVDPDGNTLDKNDLKELASGFYILKEFLCHYNTL